MSAPRTHVCSMPHRNGPNPAMRDIKGRDPKLWAFGTSASALSFHFFGFILVLALG